ncbi:MAG: restriction endonuclease subunit S [Alphaproteobacteria bacterium]|nr:restriction endonuclease subunit S [Alphaproteobacteria bacterium]
MTISNNKPTLRFAEFTDEWQEKRLGDVTLKIGGGSTPRGGDRVYCQDGIVFIRSQNIYNNKLDLTDIVYIPSNIHLQMKNSEVQRYDILLNITGASIGRSCVVPFNFTTGNVSQHVCIIRLKKTLCPNLFHLVLSSATGQDFIKKNQSGSGREGINFKNIASFNFRLPSLPEQQRIAEFLSAVDDKITLLQRKKAGLENYKKAMMQKLFPDAPSAGSGNGHSASSGSYNLKVIEPAEMPTPNTPNLRFPNFTDEWQERRLGEVVDCLDNQRIPINESGREKIQGNIPYYGANGIQGYVNDYLFDEDLVLLAEDGGNFNDFFDKPIAQKITGKSWVNNHAHVLKAIKDAITVDYLFYSLVHKDIRKYIVGGSRVKLNRGDLLSIKISLPSLPEQQKIADFLSALDTRIDAVAKQLTQADNFKKYLMQNMFV